MGNRVVLCGICRQMPIPLRELSIAMNQNDLTFARSFCIATQVEVISDPVPDQRPSFANSIRPSITADSDSAYRGSNPCLPARLRSAGCASQGPGEARTREVAPKQPRE